MFIHTAIMIVKHILYSVDLKAKRSWTMKKKTVTESYTDKIVLLIVTLSIYKIDGH